jgi:predicted amidohydrolase YtcJ
MEDRWMEKTLAIFALTVLFVLSLTSCTSPSPSTSPETPVVEGVSADLVMTNGVVYSADDADTFYEAIAVKDGQIMALGNSGEVEQYIGSDTEVIDLEGKMILPGFIDSHMHPPGNVLREMYSISLSWRDDKETILEKVAAFVEANPDLDAYYGGGWSVGVFEDLESTLGPNKEALDAIMPDKPVILRSYDGHSTWVNSKALEVAGIDAESANPDGGVIERDPETGELWGTLKGMGFDTLPTQEYSYDQVLEGVTAFQDFMHSLGYTGFFTPYPSAGAAPGYDFYKALRQLEESDELKLWVRAATRIDINLDEDLDTQIANLKKARDDYSGELFKITNAKIFMDGTVEAVTAKLLEPYEEEAGMGSDYTGIYYWEDMDALREAFTKLNSEGFSVHVHSIGDRATKEALDAFEDALAEVPGDHRNAITHLQVVDYDDIPRFAELGVIANTQVYWHMKEPDWWEEVDYPFLGDRAEYEYPLNSFFESGAVVASSSDYSVTDPPVALWAIETGVTRNLNNAEFYEVDDIEGIDDPTWLLNKDERTSLENMIKSFTANNAYALFLDDYTGTIEVGKYADLVILDQDLFSIDPQDIDGVEVLKTIFRGMVVYESK